MAVWAAVAVAVVLLLMNLQDVVNSVQGKLEAWKYQRLADKMSAPYKNDKYGGKTPEETFDLFLDALRKEDIELASKYFVIPRRESWEKTLQEYKGKGLLANFLVELENNRKIWTKSPKTDSDVTEFSYSISVEENSTIKIGDKEFPIEKGEYTNTARFEKYPSGIWKINML